MLLEVTRAHLVFFENGTIDGVDLGELLLVVSVSPGMQAKALRIKTGHVVHITTLDTFEQPPTYMDALR